MSDRKPKTIEIPADKVWPEVKYIIFMERLENTVGLLKTMQKAGGVNNKPVTDVLEEASELIKSLQERNKVLTEALENTADCFSDWVIGGGNKSATLVLASAYKIIKEGDGDEPTSI